jgi:hypothetical protein
MVRAATRVTTDKPLYGAWDTVAITGRVQNVAANAILAASRVELTVRGPSGTVLYADTRKLGELAPGGLSDLPFSLKLSDAATGSYPVELILKDEFTRTVLSTATTSFQVEHRALQGIVGSVLVNLPTVYLGDPDVCNETAQNVSATALSGVKLIHQLINMDQGIVLDEVTETVDLLAGGQVRSYFRNINTATLGLGGYACVIKAELNGEARTLAFGGFRIVEPPIRLEATLKAGTQGRLLVLLDNPNDCGEHEDDNHDDKRRHTSSSTGGHHDDDRGKCAAKDSDPHGPKSAPTLTAQRAFLESLLKEAGFSYTLTERAQDFTRELRSGNYSAYALLAEQEKLSESAQRELKEAVFRGEGLLVAGAHDARHHDLNEALGLKLIGSFAHASQALLIDSPLNLTGSLDLLAGDKALRVKRTTAQALARYLLTTSGRSHDEDDAPDCCDLARRHASLAQGLSFNPREEPDECGGHPDHFLDAATLNAYGRGKSAFVGFDLLAAATREGASSLSAQTLKALLEAVAPTALPPTAGSVQPLALTITNRGIATAATAAVTLPAGVTVLDAPAGQVTPDTVTFTANLAAGEEQTLTFWVKLPGATGPVTFNATVTAGNPPAPKATAAYTLEVQIPDLAQLKTRLAALNTSTPEERRALKRALDELDRAYHNFYPHQAIEHILNVTEALAHLADPAATALRAELGEWIRYAWGVMQ